METIYSDIEARTGGNIYIGVVGPVRTGKSTLIKRIMEALVIPCIDDPYRAERAKDELPQSGSGKTIMTSEPKFVPEEAVEISPDGTSHMKIRMIDSVGYMIDGAAGAEENGVPRMVTTPWFDHEIPLTDAAELGTQKVMQDHSSVGIMVTTDGTITDIPRSDYIAAERRAILDLKAAGKPFAVVINTRDPNSESAASVKQELMSQYGIDAMTADCQSMDTDVIARLFKMLLCSFPLTELQIRLPRWVDALDTGNPVKSGLYTSLLECAQNIHTLSQAENALLPIRELEQVSDCRIQSVNLGTGIICFSVVFPEAMFYEILSTASGIPIGNDGELLKTLTELSAMRQKYQQVEEALESAKTTGYGIVMPTLDDTTLEPPEVVKKGSSYGVKLKAAAPSIHMIRVDVNTEINPMVGGEQQSQDLISFLSGENSEALWDSNIFGKSVHALIQEGMTAKLIRTPAEVRDKFRGSLTRIVNEGASGLICIIL